jgi:hypothetical protein
MVAGDITSGDEVACPASNVVVEDVPSGLTLESPPNATSTQLSIADVVSMDSDAPDGCQGMSFNIALVLTGAQVD